MGGIDCLGMAARIDRLAFLQTVGPPTAGEHDKLTMVMAWERLRFASTKGGRRRAFAACARHSPALAAETDRRGAGAVCLEFAVWSAGFLAARPRLCPALASIG